MARGKALEDLTGRKIHRLTFLEYVGREEGSNSRWKVRCECGKEFIVYACNVKAGRITSCGCYLKEIIQKRFKKN